MQVAEWVRAALLRAEDWRAELAALRGDDFDLGCACEEIDPDRSRALGHFLAAWRKDDIQAKARATALALELHDHAALAELAVADSDHAGAAAAYVDAGMFEAAREQLTKSGASTIHAKTLALIAKKELRDPHRELAQYVARNEWPMAIRIASVTGDPMWSQVLGNAVRKAPRDQAVAALVEERLLARGNAEELLEHYRVRFDAARGGRAWVECVRSAAVDLITRGKQVGLGLRLLRRALDNAVIEQLVDVPRFVASVELLVEHARSAKTTRELLPFLADAVRLPFEPIERVYLALAGLQIAWREANDVEAARPFAAIVIEHAPHNRLAQAFVAATLLTDELDAPAAPVASGRGAPRKILPIDVSVELPGRELLLTIARDVSTSGLFLITPRSRRIPLGTIVTLDLPLPDPSGLAQTRYRITAKVARMTELGVGLAFVDPPAAVVAAIAALT